MWRAMLIMWALCQCGIEGDVERLNTQEQVEPTKHRERPKVALVKAELAETIRAGEGTEETDFVLCEPVIAEIAICGPDGQAFMVRVTICSGGLIGGEGRPMEPSEQDMFCGGVP